ncbi:hypothetical protein CROQUDRAFT_269634 [Cronartium quercuum f. sp. fusiforme G11]|uniref:Uncharacterized protein n=1 Tax=Cronartium quercuum f. sp. fusiforme G11 TaxID=708437 RepID=A0A9P6T7S5_9BASI|nr:hypothetical protein CROQUDRAFT_269634 [Cronartium quercuum f. sp. fusiforme G11]
MKVSHFLVWYSSGVLCVSISPLGQHTSSTQKILEGIEKLRPLNPQFKFQPESKTSPHFSVLPVNIQLDPCHDEFAFQRTLGNVFFTSSRHESLRMLGKQVNHLEFFKPRLESTSITEMQGWDEANALALQALEINNLPIQHRIWALSVLQTLHSKTPSGHLEILRTDIKEGAVCRGALELSLTKDINLIEIAKKI